MRVLFVTGTDTGVGKTVTTAALVLAARAAGRNPYVIKPVQTGAGPGEPGDLDAVRGLAGDVPGHEGARLPDPLAPDTAARLAGIRLPGLSEQAEAILQRARDHLVIVEGAGGVLVRLGESWTVLDLAEQVAAGGPRVSFAVVARAGLGTLNHSALTVDAIRQRSLAVDGIVIGSWPEEPDLAAEQNLGDLPAHTGAPLLGRIPEGAGALAPAVFQDLAPLAIQL